MAFAVITVALVGAGFWYYQAQAKAIHQNSYETIAAISKMKVGQIVQWQKERLIDVTREAHSPTLIRGLGMIARNAETPEIRDQVREILKLSKKQDEYSNIIALSPSGQVLFSTSDGPVSIDTATQRAVEAARANPSGVISDFFRTSEGEVDIDAVAAARDAGGSVLGFIVFRCRAAIYLYPLIQSWPMPSRSAETLLVEREGEDVVFLNELRHRSKTGLSFRHSLKQADMPAVQAVLGRHGMFDGKDYRNVKVLADLSPIPGTPWFMVAKVDAAEIMAEADYRAYGISVIVGAFILLGAASTAHAYRRLQVDHLREVVELERQQREVLHKSEQDYRRLFEGMLEGFALHEIVCDESGKPVDYRFLSVNPAFERITGLSAKNLVGRTVLDVMPETEMVWIERYGRVALTGEPDHFEEYNHPLKRHFKIEAFSPQIGQFVVVFEDITKRKQSEVRLRLQSGALEAAANAIVITDSKGVIQWANAAFTSYTGYSVAEAIGKTPSLLKSGKQDPAFYQNLWKTILAGEVWHGEMINRRKDGSHYPEEMTITPMKDKQGEVTHFIAVKNDISERKQAEGTLRASEERYRSILNASPDAIFITDMKDGRHLMVSPGAVAMFGCDSEQDMVGALFTDFIVPEDRERIASNVALTLQGKFQGLVEYRAMRADGSTFDMEANGEMIRDAEGFPTQMVAIVRDITERKQMQEDMLRTHRIESIGRLAAGVAHDLNNILTPIILSAEMLRQVKESETRESIIETIEECAQRGANVVNQVLTFGRGAKGERTTLQLNRIGHEIVKVIRETFPKNIAIINSIPSDLWPVKADSTQIHQILLNLCINARDAMPEGGSLLITGENVEIDENFAAMVPDARPEDYAMVSISDSGSGIPSEIIGKIFDPFFTTKEIGKGTGLGLSTVIGIVRSHGGFVTVKSGVDRGSNFKVFLPREADGTLEQEPLVPVKMLQGEGETILLVDDEMCIAKMTSAVLENNGYKVLAAAEGTDALALYGEHANVIKVVLTDVMMPGMDGLKLTRALKEINPLVKVIASTGQATESRQAELQALGVNVILHKPYDAKKLLKALHEAIHAEGA